MHIDKVGFHAHNDTPALATLNRIFREIEELCLPQQGVSKNGQNKSGRRKLEGPLNGR